MPSSTPIYGLRYPLATDPVPVLPTDIQNLAEDIETTFDLVTGAKKIIPTATGHTNITFDSQGNGTPSTGVSSFTVSNVFTTEFDVYRIQWNGAVHSTGAVVLLNYPNVLTGYYGTVIINRPNNSTPTSFVTDNNNTTHNELTYFTPSGGLLSVDIVNPATSGVATTIYNRRLEINGTGSALGRYMGFVSSTASISSFRVWFAAGTITTAGNVSIYGWEY